MHSALVLRYVLKAKIRFNQANHYVSSCLVLFAGCFTLCLHVGRKSSLDDTATNQTAIFLVFASGKATEVLPVDQLQPSAPCLASRENGGTLALAASPSLL